MRNWTPSEKMGLISLLITIIAFVASIIVMDLPKVISVFVPLFLVTLFVLFAFLFFSKRESQVLAGSQVYRFSQTHRKLSSVGMIIVVVIFLFLGISQSVRTFVVGAFAPTSISTTIAVAPSISATVTTATIVSTPTPSPSSDILISEFEGNENVTINFPGRLEEDLIEALQSNNLDEITVGRTTATIKTYGEAKAFAIKTNAKIVIYGYYDDIGASVKVFVNEPEMTNDALPQTSEVFLMTANSPSEIVFLVSEVVPKSTTVISLFIIGQLSYYNNDAQAGRAAFDAAMNAATSNVSIENDDIVQFLMARNLDATDSGTKEELICGYAKALEINPNLAAAYNNLALVLLREFPFFKEHPNSDVGTMMSYLPEDISECLVQANLTDINPKSLFDTAYQLGNGWQVPRFNKILHYPNDLEDWTSELEEIIDVDPSFLGPYIALGAEAFLQNEPNTALQYFLKAITLKPPNQYEELYINVAQAYLGTGDLEMAEQYFTLAKSKSYTRDEALIGLANIHKQDLTKAISYIDQLTTADSTFLLANVLRAHSTFMQGNTEEAIQILEQLKESKSEYFSMSNNAKTYSTDAYLNFLIATILNYEGKTSRANAYFSEITFSGGNILAIKDLEIAGGTFYNTWGEISLECGWSASYFSRATPDPENTVNTWGSSKNLCLPADSGDRVDFVFHIFEKHLEQRIYYSDFESLIPKMQCPFVFSFNSVSQSWDFETTILYQIVSKDNERTQTRELTMFDGRLLIREVEPEVSRIDATWVIVEDIYGNYHELYPSNALLNEADGDYLILHQGDAILLEFPEFKTIENPKRFFVVARGYYEPNYIFNDE